MSLNENGWGGREGKCSGRCGFWLREGKEKLVLRFKILLDGTPTHYFCYPCAKDIFIEWGKGLTKKEFEPERRKFVVLQDELAKYERNQQNTV